MTNNYVFGKVASEIANESKENNDSRITTQDNNSDKTSGNSDNNWNLGIILIAIFLILAVLAIGFYLKKKN